MHTYNPQRPPIPYGQQDNITDSLWFEDGFKECVGYLTEGRYLVFEKGGVALTNKPNRHSLSVSPAMENHEAKSHRWVIHYSDDEESSVFTLSSALDGRWLGPRGILVDSHQLSDAEQIRIVFLGNGRGYTLQYANSGQYIDIDHDGSLKLVHYQNGPRYGYRVFSVTYHQ